MPRPQKKGIDYFPFDVDFFSDQKIRILKAAYGNNGVMLYIYILTQIYRNGYYMEATDDVIALASSDLGISISLTKQIVSYLVSRSLLKSILADSVTVLTSAGIQRRYQAAVHERAKKNVVYVEKAIWLLSEAETDSLIKVCQKKVIPGKNSIIPGKNHSKSREKSLKESKVKESKVKESKVGPADAVVREVVDGFNRTCRDLPKVSSMTQNREKLIQDALKERSPFDLIGIFQSVQNSDFLCGRKGGGWKASFDWIMKPENLVKIAEGNYENRESPKQEGMWRSEIDFDEIERMARQKLFEGR